MSETADRRVYRRPPTWQIRAADGTLRVVGGTEPDWWDAARPADPEPPAIYSADCTETPR